MGVLICFAAFLAGLVVCLAAGWNLLWAILWGLGLFFGLGLKRGIPAGELASAAWKKGRDSSVVLFMFLAIGLVTAAWRSSGTIAFLLYHGLRSIRPDLFLLVAFLLTLGMSFLMGSSFGVIATAGVVLVTLARSGGVDVSIAAGAVISGAFFGDRCSNLSSSAALVAAVTGTDQYHNVKLMLKTGALPTLLTAVFFFAMSRLHPISAVDGAVLSLLESRFSLHWVVALPALLVLVLPLCRVNARLSLLLSAAAALAVAVLVQGGSLKESLRAMVLGYAPADPALASLLGGGGLRSVVMTAAMVLAIGFYVGVLERMDVLTPMRRRLDRLADRIGLFPTAILTSLAVLMLFCNQSVMILMGESLLAEPYRRHGARRQELAIDLENSGIVLVGLIPWNIAVTLALATLNVGFGALPWSVYLYLVPLCYLVTRPLFRKTVTAEKGSL